MDLLDWFGAQPATTQWVLIEEYCARTALPTTHEVYAEWMDSDGFLADSTAPVGDTRVKALGRVVLRRREGLRGEVRHPEPAKAFHRHAEHDLREQTNQLENELAEYR